MTRTRLRVLLAVLLTIALAFALAACGDDDDDGAAASTAAGTTPAAACDVGSLPLVSDGQLTVGTDTPAFPPYYEDDDPTNGKGFESAVAYAIADELGFAPADVAWTTVPFNNSYAPGPKKFDFDINQISITAPRAKQVDFSAPYYTTPQAVLVGKGSAYATATTFAELSDAQIGVQVGTTSLDAVNDVISPSKQPRVYNDSNDTVRALKSGQVDAIVVDLPTAFFLSATEIDGGSIVGQFAAPGGDDWGVVLAKDSGLTPCVDAAIGRLRDSGELEKITAQWIGAEAVPELT
jgi:polar amino acid transport system substrate-binding protein